MKVGGRPGQNTTPPVQDNAGVGRAGKRVEKREAAKRVEQPKGRRDLAQPGKLQQLMTGGGVPGSEQFAKGRQVILATIQSAAQTGSAAKERANPNDAAWENVAMSMIGSGGGAPTPPGDDRSATPINLPRTADSTTGSGSPVPPGGDRSATPINLPRTIDQVVDQVKRGDLGAARTEWENIAGQIGDEERDNAIQHVLHQAFVQPNEKLSAIGSHALTPENDQTASGVESILLDEASTLNRMFLTASAFAQNQNPEEEEPVQG